MTKRLAATSWLFSLGVAAAPCAQEPAVPEPAPAPEVTIEQVYRKMLGLAGVAFTTIEESDDVMTRRLRHAMPGRSTETELSGTWSAETLFVTFEDGDEEVVERGGRALARPAGGVWKRRHGTMSDGRPLPFVFHPRRFFEILADLPPEAHRVLHRETATWREQELAVLGLTIDGDAARDLVFGGGLPTPGTHQNIIVLAAGGGAARRPPPDITIDLAFYVEPETGLVHRLKARCDSAGSTAFGTMIVAGGGEQAEEPEEEVEEFDAGGKRNYRHGLPVRKLDDRTSRIELDVRFEKHGQSLVPALDDAARRLLDHRGR